MPPLPPIPKLKETTELLSDNKFFTSSLISMVPPISPMQRISLLYQHQMMSGSKVATLPVQKRKRVTQMRVIPYPTWVRSVLL